MASPLTIVTVVGARPQFIKAAPISKTMTIRMIRGLSILRGIRMVPLSFSGLIHFSTIRASSKDSF